MRENNLPRGLWRWVLRILWNYASIANARIISKDPKDPSPQTSIYYWHWPQNDVPRDPYGKHGHQQKNGRNNGKITSDCKKVPLEIGVAQHHLNWDETVSCSEFSFNPKMSSSGWGLKSSEDLPSSLPARARSLSLHCSHYLHCLHCLHCFHWCQSFMDGHFQWEISFQQTKD